MNKKNNNDEPSVWVTALKLVLGLIVIVGGVGLVLWYAKDMNNGALKPPGGDSWGVSKDSPLRLKR